MNFKFSLTILLAVFFIKNATAQCLQTGPCITQSCDVSTNDALFWNEIYWWDPTHEIHDLSDSPSNLSFSVTDTCGNVPADLRYLLFLDLDRDGIRETVVSSDDLPAAGQLRFGNAQNPQFQGGTLRNFDERPVVAADKFRFTLEQTVAGNTRTARVRWESAATPGVFVDVSLPHGNHRIQWFSGQTMLCDQAFEAKDCQKPTVVCVNGLTVNLMPTCIMVIWSSDFLQYGEDNATPANLLVYSLRRAGTGQGFPDDHNGNPISGLTFTGNDLGTQHVELWVRDKAGNADFCETYIIVQDPNGNCESLTGLDLRVNVKNPQGKGMEEVSVEAIVSPAGSQVILTNGNGFVNFKIPPGSNCTVTPYKDDNHLNGVSTFDLVLISKHILGTAIFDSPYKYFAADANKSFTVTTFDMVEIRKVILGIYSEFPNNSSWRFFDDRCVFPPYPLSQQCSGSITLTNFSQPDTIGFVGVKTGDVNFTAVVNLDGSDDRATLPLLVDDQILAAGETVLVPVSASQRAQWLGFQGALRFDSSVVVVEEVVPGNLPDLSAESFAQPAAGVLRASWFSAEAVEIEPTEPLFFLKIRALQTVRLSEALRFDDQKLRAEAYDAAGRHLDLDLFFQEKNTLAGQAGFSPLQPNPASEVAVFQLNLPEKTAVRWQVFDLAGRKLLEENVEAEAGFNRFEVPVFKLKNAGLYAYRVQAGEGEWSGRFVKN